MGQNLSRVGGLPCVEAMHVIADSSDCTYCVLAGEKLGPRSRGGKAKTKTSRD